MNRPHPLPLPKWILRLRSGQIWRGGMQRIFNRCFEFNLYLWEACGCGVRWNGDLPLVGEGRA